jgi:hypothetical protein
MMWLDSRKRDRRMSAIRGNPKRYAGADLFSVDPNRILQPIRLTMDFAIIQPKLSTIGLIGVRRGLN